MRMPGQLSRQQKRQQNQGVAIIMATVVGMVLMVLALSLLLASYALFSSVSRERKQMQCREVTTSIARELRQEILTPGYDTYKKQKEQEDTDNRLWFFLRYNIWQSSWPYYNEGESGHEQKDSYRYFTLNALEDSRFEGMADQVLLTFYWEVDSDKNQAETEKDTALLHVKVETTKDEYAYAMESEYILTADEVLPYEEGGEILAARDTSDNTEINPAHNSIYMNEKWVWSLKNN